MLDIVIFYHYYNVCFILCSKNMVRTNPKIARQTPTRTKKNSMRFACDLSLSVVPFDLFNRLLFRHKILFRFIF